ncbi:hypothetical protein MNBD_NITROSPINAE01-1652 [hydrothermal vent metagenome]|uniref:Outer membrane protein beta-barrel domain-containing protein n=1 Tax=hydrothermal vent metagenome TaxID=652676 RepID=A0A3B1BU35_9ZZZZ
MKRPLIFSLMVMLAITFTAPVSFAESEWTGNINALVGKRMLENSKWEPLDDQWGGGLEFDFKQKSWPVSILFSVSGSSKDEDICCVSDGIFLYSVNNKVETLEMSAGLKKYFALGGNAFPYVAVGGSYIEVETSSEAGSFVSGSLLSRGNDSTTGGFVNGGVMWKMEMFNVGFDIRKLFGTSLKNGFDVDYYQYSLLLGFGW